MGLMGHHSPYKKDPPPFGCELRSNSVVLYECGCGLCVGCRVVTTLLCCVVVLLYGGEAVISTLLYC